MPRYFVILVLVFASNASIAANLKEAISRLSASIPAAKQQWQIPGIAIAIAKSDTLVYRHISGVKSLNQRGNIDAETVFRLASVSKSFASVLTALMIEEGKFDWNTPVSHYFPEFQLANSKPFASPTIEQLLSHQTGLPPYAYDNLLEDNMPLVRIIERLKTVDLICPAGQCYSYQNVAFSAIANVLESASNRPYRELIQQKILSPLGMNRTSQTMRELVSSDNWAHPHIKRRGIWKPWKVTSQYYKTAASSGINASINDLGTWLMALMGQFPEVISQDLLDELQKKRVHTQSEMYRPRWRRVRLDDAAYGLGLRIYDYSGHSLIFHGGAVSGYRSMIALLPTQKIGMVALWNSDNGKPWRFLPVFLDTLLGLPEVDWLDLEPSESLSSINTLSAD